MFPGGYDYRSVKVNGMEYTDVAVPLICMAAGLQNHYTCHSPITVIVSIEWNYSAHDGKETQ